LCHFFISNCLWNNSAYLFKSDIYMCIYECVVCIPIERCVRRRQSADGLRQHVSHVSRYSSRWCNICRTDKPDFTRKNLFFPLLSTCSDGEIFGTKKKQTIEWPGCADFVDCSAYGKECAALFSILLNAVRNVVDSVRCSIKFKNHEVVHRNALAILYKWNQRIG